MIKEQSLKKNVIDNKNLVENTGDDLFFELTAILNPIPEFKITKKVPFTENLTLSDVIKYAKKAVEHQRMGINVNGITVLRENWDTFIINPNDRVIIKAVPMGGGEGEKNPFVLIAGIALSFFAPWAGGQLASAMGFSATGLVASTLTVGIGLLGSLAISALVPTPSLNNGTLSPVNNPSPSYSISGVRNQALHYQTVPKVYGKVLIYPPLAAAPFTNVSAGKQLLTMLFGIYGEVNIYNKKIGNTALDNFEGVLFSHVKGNGVTPPKSSIYSKVVDEEVININITPNYFSGPKYNIPSGPYYQRTTSLDTIEITCDFIAPNGLVAIREEDGSRIDRKVEIEILFKLTTDSEWLSVADPVAVNSGKVPAFQNSDIEYFGDYEGFNPNWKGSYGTTVLIPGVASRFSGNKSGEEIRKAVSWDVPKGQYDVKVRIYQITSTFNHNKPLLHTVDDVFWVNIKSKVDQNPIQNPNLDLFALRIQASDQLNNVIDQFNFEAFGVINNYTGTPGVWSKAETKNPASIYRDILQGNASPKPLPNSLIDITALEYFHSYCVSKGWEFNALVDTNINMFEMLRAVCAAGRASPTIIDGKFSVIIDEPKTVPVQWITSLNSYNFSGSMVYPDVPHGLKIRYKDETKNYQQAERIVYSDGYDKTNSSIFEVIDFFGITKSDLIWKHGRFALAVLKLRPEEFSVTMDLENIVCTRGDLVRFAHDVILVGLGRGRIKSFTVDGSSNVNSITLTRKVIMESGKSYGIVIRKNNGTEITATVTTSPGETSTLTINPVIPAANAPDINDLVMFGLSGNETIDCLVRGVFPKKDLTAEVVLINYSPEVFNSDSGEIPAFDPGLTIPPVLNFEKPPSPSVVSIISDEGVALLAGNNIVPRIKIILSTPTGDNFNPTDLALTVQIRENKDQYNYTDDYSWRNAAIIALGNVKEVYIDNVLSLIKYDIRLRYVSTGGFRPGLPSDWTSINAYQVIGLSTPPPDVINLRKEGTVLRWDYDNNPPIDVKGYLIRYTFNDTVNWSTGIDILRGAFLTTREFYLDNFPAGQIIIMIKALDTEGNVSLNPAYVSHLIPDFITKDIGSPLPTNIVVTKNHVSLGWLETNNPEKGLTPTNQIPLNDVIDPSLDFTRTSDSLFSIYGFIDSVSSGTIFEVGDRESGAFVGFNKDGDLILRAGDGDLVFSDSDTVRLVITEDDFKLLGLTGTLAWQFDINPGRIRVWYNSILIGEKYTSAKGALKLNQWTNTNAGSYGTYSGNVLIDESINTELENITNGTFDTDLTGWTAIDSVISLSSNKIRVTNSVGGLTNGRAYQEVNLIQGETYILFSDFTYGGSVAGGLYISTTTDTADSINQITSSVTKKLSGIVFIAPSDTLYVILSNNGSVDNNWNEFDNISLKVAHYIKPFNGELYSPLRYYTGSVAPDKYRSVGLLINGDVESSELRADPVGELYLPDGSALYLPTGTDLYLPSTYLDMVYESDIYLPDPTYIPGMIYTDIGFTGDGYLAKYRTGPLDTEVLSNVNFDTDTIWVKDAGWSIASGVATKASSGSIQNMNQSCTLIPGIYSISVDVSSYTSGNLYFEASGGLKVDAVRSKPVSVAGVSTVYLEIRDQNNFRIIGDSLFIGSITSISLKRILFSDWLHWPGHLNDVKETQPYQFYIKAFSSSRRGIINKFNVIFDVEDVEENLNDIVISSAGTTRLPINKTYNTITNVSLTIINDGGGAVYAKVLDKNASLGPMVETRNSSNTLVQGKVDARIKGY